MGCPYNLPVKPVYCKLSESWIIKDINGYVVFADLNITKAKAKYIVQAFNNHEKLKDALRENYEYTKYAGANKRINTAEYMDEFFNRGLSAQKMAEQALKEAEK